MAELTPSKLNTAPWKISVSAGIGVVGFYAATSILIYAGAHLTEAGSALVQLMSSLIPMLDGLTQLKGYRAEHAFFYSFFWLLSPSMIWVGWIYRKAAPESFGGAWRSDIKLAWTLVIGIFCLVVFMFWPMTPGSQTWRNQALVGGVFSTFYYIGGASGSLVLVGAVARMLFARLKYGNVDESNLLK